MGQTGKNKSWTFEPYQVRTIGFITPARTLNSIFYCNLGRGALWEGPWRALGGALRGALRALGALEAPGVAMMVSL